MSFKEMLNIFCLAHDCQDLLTEKFEGLTTEEIARFCLSARQNIRFLLQIYEEKELPYSVIVTQFRCLFNQIEFGSSRKMQDFARQLKYLRDFSDFQ